MSIDCRSFVSQLMATLQCTDHQLISDTLSTILSSISWNEGDKKLQYCTILTLQGSSFSFEIQLRVHKGSLLTTLWNPYARFDDEYSSILSVKDQSEDSNLMLWHVSGLDFSNRRILTGSVNWALMLCLQKEIKTEMIGLYCFGKLFIHSLINLPAFLKYGELAPPMPASLMHNCLLMVESCPVSIGLPKSFITPTISDFVLQFRDDSLGHALWINGLLPYWDTKEKKLCRITDALVNLSVSAVFPVDMLQDIGVRIVEIFETPLAPFDIAVIVEVINKRNWLHMWRFVVTDIATLNELCSSQASPPSSKTFPHHIPHSNLSDSKSNSKRRKKASNPVTAVQLYDQQDWSSVCAEWDSEHNSNKGYSHHYVDFQNSYRWGISRK